MCYYAGLLLLVCRQTLSLNFYGTGKKTAWHTHSRLTNANVDIDRCTYLYCIFDLVPGTPSLKQFSIHFRVMWGHTYERLFPRQGERAKRKNTIHSVSPVVCYSSSSLTSEETVTRRSQIGAWPRRLRNKKIHSPKVPIVRGKRVESVCERLCVHKPYSEAALQSVKIKQIQLLATIVLFHSAGKKKRAYSW